MSCIRTGANVHLTDYGRVLHCDLFRVGDTIIVKAWPDQLHKAPMAADFQSLGITHTMELPSSDSESWPDRGIFIAPLHAVSIVSPITGKAYSLHSQYSGDGGYFNEAYVGECGPTPLGT